MRLLALLVADIERVGELEVRCARFVEVVPDDEIGLLPMVRAAAAIAVLIVDRDRGIEHVRFAGIKAVSSLETVDQSSPERLLDGIAAPALVVVVFRAVAVDLRRRRSVDAGELVAVHVVAGAEHHQPDDLPASVLLERPRIERLGRERCQSCALRKSSRRRRRDSGSASGDRVLTSASRRAMGTGLSLTISTCARDQNGIGQ